LHALRPTPPVSALRISNHQKTRAKLSPQALAVAAYRPYHKDILLTQVGAPMRIAHTMLRVTDLNASLRFYQNALGMHLLRRQDYPEGRFTLAFVGFQEEHQEAVLELTYNWDTSHYDMGDAFGHVAIETDDIEAACAAATHHGGQLIRPPAPMKHGTTVIAFIEDPDGYKIEFIQRQRTS